MESPILRQIAKFLQERKNQKRWKVVFVCLAVIVGAGTVIGLRMMGLAMTHKERVLDCQYEVHKHEETCYDEENNLICGYADYVVHKHNDDCYNADLKLVCPLPEIEKHEHTKECYNEMVLLVCGQEEAAGHEHTDACYTKKKGSLACTAEEHKHTDACYEEEKNLTCNLEEHTHDDNCYNWENVLTCTLPAGEGGHKHTEACYQKQEGLTCGQLEMHTHTEKCFEKIDKDGTDEPDNLRLVCDKVELTEHVHTEAFGCLKTVEVAPGETAEEAAEKDAENDGVFTTDLNGEGENGADGAAAEGEDSEAVGDGTGEAAEGEEGADGEGAGEAGTDGETAEGEGGETAGDGTGEAAEGADGEEAGGEEPEGSTNPEDYEETKTYEGLGYIVSASYNKEANIPEEAKLIAEQITEVSDSEDYKKHEAEFKKNMGDENATMSALFKIGFYVDNEEVEPESPVLVTIQFVDKHGLPEGAPIKVVHFGDEDTEVIDGGKAESGSTSFKTKGFSKFAVGFSEKEEADVEKTSVHIAKTETYEDDVFQATFHIEGDIEVSKEAADDIQSDGEGKAEKETGEEENASDDNAESAEDAKEGTEGSEDTEETAESEETSGKEKNDTEDTATPDAAVPETDKDEKLKFEIKAVNEGSDKYASAVEQAGGSDEMGAMLRLQVLSCSLTYDGEEVDISDCKVTAEITTSDVLNEQAKESIPDTVKQLLGDEEKIAEVGEEIIDNGTEITVKAMGINGAKVNTLGQTYLNEKKAEEPIVCEFDAVEEEVVLTARSQANPHFKVEYFANLKVMSNSGSNAFSIIDTSKSGNETENPVLPSNGTTPKTKNMYADNDGNIQYTDKQVEIYRSREFDYVMAPSLMYFDALVENKDSYKLVGIEVSTTKIEDGKPITSTTKYNEAQLANLHFTNRPKTAENLEYALIEEGTVIRLLYDVVDTQWDSDVVFYDYDVSDGKIYNSANKAGGTINRSDTDKTWYIYTEQSGINSPTNYSGTGDKLAFGNGEGVLPTSLGDVQHNNNKINAATGNYSGCSFGIVTGLQDGKLAYADGIIAPNLFNEGDAAGKTTYNDYDLRFIRNGDTYTLTSVTGTQTTDLHKFGRHCPNWNNTRTLWSNEFWPMDNVEYAGKDGHDPKFKYDNTNLIAFDSKNNKRNAPSNDYENTLHNPYFGMMYQVEFDLSTDYIGPLEYYFFGDDDMWVFLDGQLVCDIGGVHGSVGEYVDLKDYLKDELKANESHKHGKECYDEKGKLTCSRKHVLSFFYTERGASGSTCWMQFTLPSISSMTPEQASGQFTNSLQVGKTVENANPDQRFEFQIHFQSKDGADLPDDYCYTRFKKKRKLDSNGNPAFDANGKPIYVEKKDAAGNPVLDADGKPVYETEVLDNDIIISDGDTFWLGDGEYIIVNYLPQGTTYTITEVRPEQGKDDYDINIDGDKENSGVITDEMGKVDTTVEYVNEYHQYELPKTGGSGMIIYTIAGALCILLGAGFMYTKKAKERRV